MQQRQRDVEAIRKQIEDARRNPPTFPEGHTVAIAFAMVFGPRNATTPEGHPITISSGPFDLTVETPQHAIARAARQWMGIEIHEPHWEIEMAEDVVIPDGHPIKATVRWSKFFHLRYLPERETKWKERGLHDGNVTNHFKQSWYLTRNWQTVDGGSADSIHTGAPIDGGSATAVHSDTTEGGAAKDGTANSATSGHSRDMDIR